MHITGFINIFAKKASALLSMALILSSCLPMQKQTQCADNEAYDATRRICLPVVGASSSSSVFINGKTPSSSYTSSISGSSVTHSISVSDVYGYGYTTQWKLHYTNGVTTINGFTLAANTSSYTFNPTGMFGTGNYILEAILYDSTGTYLLDSVSWSITLNQVTTPTLVSPSPSGTAYSYANNITSATHSLNILNVGSLSGNYTWYLDGASVSSGSFTSATASLSYNFNPSTLSIGLHTLELSIDSTTADHYDDYNWTINIMNPDLPAIVSTTPTYANSIIAVDGQDMATDNGYLETPYDPVADIITQICVTVDDPDKDNDNVSDIDVEFAINGVVEHISVFAPVASTSYCYGSFSAQTLANPDVAEAKTLSIRLYKTGTSQIIDYRNYNLTVRPKNIRPTISIVSALDNSVPQNGICTTTTSSSYYTGCSSVQSLDANDDGDYVDADDADNAVDLTISYVDSDITSSADYEVYFEMKKNTDASFSPLDGNNQYSKTDCYPVSSGDELTCTMNFDAFTTSGHIEPGIYLVRAFLRDNGSTWDVGNQKESNYVTWEINITEYQDAASLSLPDLITAGVPSDDVWFEQSDSLGTSTGTVLSSITEGSWVILHVPVKDLERDNFIINTEIANGLADNSGNSFSALTTSQYITRSDDSEYYEVELLVQIPEWVVADGVTGIPNVPNWKFNVTVADDPDTASANTLTKTFQITVNNYNPAPSFANSSDVSLGVDVFAGFPLTIAPPSYTDASLFDGKNVTWKWQVSVDATHTTWTDIPNADSDTMSNTTLYWTPDPHIDNTTITDVSLRLCLGDDGYGNDPDCATASATKVYDTIMVYPSNVTMDGTTTMLSDSNSAASWYDDTNRQLYVATHDSGIIYVSKIDTTTADFSSVHTISFNSEASGANSDVFSLSMSGLDSTGIIITYGLIDSGSSLPRLRTRRIDISNSKFGFHYVGLYNSTNTANDLYSINGLDDTGVDIDLSGSSNGDFQMQILTSGWNDTDYIIIRNICFDYNNAGDCPGTVTNTYTFCAGGCGSANAVATSLYAAMTSVTEAEFTEEISVSLPSTDTLSLQGLPSDDYLDNSTNVAPAIGKVQVDASGQWYLPFANSSTLSTLYLYYSTTNLSNILSTGISATTSMASTGANNQEISNILVNDGSDDYMVTITKGSSGNAYIYKHEISGTIGLSSESRSNFFNLSGYDELEKISISADSNRVWVSALAVNSSDDTYLLAGVLDFTDFDNFSRANLVSYSNSLLSFLDDQSISVTSDSDEAVIGLTTLDASERSSEVSESHLIKLYFDSSSWSNTVGFYDYTSPAMNNDPIITGGKVLLSPVYNRTLGNAGDTTNENIKDIMFFITHEFNGVNNLNIGAYNIQAETISCETTGVSGTYPANLTN